MYVLNRVENAQIYKFHTIYGDDPLFFFGRHPLMSQNFATKHPKNISWQGQKFLLLSGLENVYTLHLHLILRETDRLLPCPSVLNAWQV